MNQPNVQHEPAMTEESRRPDTLRLALHEVLDGASPEEVARRHGVRVTALREAMLEIGSTLPGSSRAIKRAFSRRRLKPEQEAALHALIQRHLPDDLGGTDLLWSREAVRWLIERETGMRFPDRTLASYLERWGFVPEKPMRVLAASQPALVRDWLRRDLPVLTMQAREAAGIVCWLGMSVLEPRTQGRWSAQQPRTAPALPWRLGETRMLFLTTNRGQSHWLVHEGAPSHALLITLLERALRMDSRRHFLIGHRHALLTAPEFLTWASGHRERLHLEIIPIG